MKPYGRGKTVHFPCKTDCHPKRGWINWWEDIADYFCRTTMKRAWKKELEEELE